MNQQRIVLSIILFVFNSIVLQQGLAETVSRVTQHFTYKKVSYPLMVPEGYQLELLTDRLDGPRLMAFDSENNLFIGSKSGAIYKLPPPYRQATVFTELDNYPHSLAFYENDIYVAQTDGIYKAKYTTAFNTIDEREFTRVADLPDTGGHNSRTIALGPNGRMYVSIGITGNCSNEYLDASYPFEFRKGGVFVFDPSAKSTELKVFASGLRNPVGFDWHPVTQKMYASNNGPDHQGFDLPPEYFSELSVNSFHGMPWFQFNGKRIVRDNCIKSKPPRPLKQVKTPAATFDARNAPMGVAFLDRHSVFFQFENSAVVALRGSWATRPDWDPHRAAASRRHPKLVLVKFDKHHQATGVVDFVTGFQFENGNRLARPVGVISGPDGALYITSDSGINGLFRLRKE